MLKKVSIKSTQELYDEGPEAFMFMPYRSAIAYKKAKARKILGEELSVHYLDQDSARVTTEYKAGEFNSSLLDEMESALRIMGIENHNEMFKEMENACEDILKKYISKKEDA